MDYSHPLGNIKIKLIKFLSKAFSFFSLKFVDGLVKNNKNFIFINNYMGQCILIKK